MRYRTAVERNLIDRHGISQERIRLAPVAIDVADISAKVEPSSAKLKRKEMGIGDDDIIIGSAGYLDKRKGCDLFVKISGRVADWVPDSSKIYFVWVGDGPEKTAMLDGFKSLGLEDRLRLVGKLENPYPYFNCFDIFLMCSRDDPFPRVNLECAVFEKPIVAFGFSGGSQEFIGDDSGIVIAHLDIDQMASAIIKLVKDPDLRTRLGKRAREKVSEYDVPIVAKNIVHFIESRYNEKKVPW